MDTWGCVSDKVVRQTLSRWLESFGYLSINYKPDIPRLLDFITRSNLLLLTNHTNKPLPETVLINNRRLSQPMAVASTGYMKDSGKGWEGINYPELDIIRSIKSSQRPSL